MYDECASCIVGSTGGWRVSEKKMRIVFLSLSLCLFWLLVCRVVYGSCGSATDAFLLLCFGPGFSAFSDTPERLTRTVSVATIARAFSSFLSRCSGDSSSVVAVGKKKKVELVVPGRSSAQRVFRRQLDTVCKRVQSKVFRQHSSPSPPMEEAYFWRSTQSILSTRITFSTPKRLG